MSPSRRIAVLVLLAFALVLSRVAISPAQEDGDGVVVERARATEAATVSAGNGEITIVRVNLQRQRLKLLTARANGGPRPLPQWLSDFHLTGGINASMFGSGNRSVGYMVREGVDENTRVNPFFGGFLAFDARGITRPLASVFGNGCGADDLPALRQRYATIVQTYRLLACDGSPIAWVDSKIYSAAAVGMDRDGRAVFVHSRTPYTMRVLAGMLAAPALHFRSLLFVEGGPEASLVVVGAHPVSEVGSWETDFHEADDNQAFWNLPNIIAFEPRN